ncbi:MAG: hypothetical protein RI909_1212, partial [Bacteroidota bacterium]
MIKPRIDYSTVQFIASCLFFILISQPSRAQHVSELTIDHLKITTVKSSEGIDHVIQ